MAKAMILAAGQGTRVRPLTKHTPKPMVPILGKPVMAYLIEHLARYDVKQIMVNVAFMHWKIENYFGDGDRWGVELGYSYEGVREQGEVVCKPVGSAGGMRKIQDFGGFLTRPSSCCAATPSSIWTSKRPWPSTRPRAPSPVS